jgi:23S rRNA (guanosine2251-2'-O)-methyltransferase
MPRHLELVYGTHSVRAVLLTRPSAVKRVVILDGRKDDTARHTRWTEEYVELTRVAAVVPQIVPWREFLRLTGLRESDKHQGICIFVEPRRLYDESDFDELAACNLVVALDQISNPHNLGTILRTSAFFGVGAVLLLRDRAADITPEVLRVASGGAEFVKVYRITNLSRSLRTLSDNGHWIYGLDERGSMAIGESDFQARSVIVVGAEGGGLRRLTKESCDFLVRIPGGRQGVESLNAAVAASIALAAIRSPRSLDSGRGKVAAQLGQGET